jgi:hypothetical protein
LNLFSDVGGVIYFIVIIVTIFFSPVLRYKQLLSILKQLYYAKTVDSNLFYDGIKKKGVAN